MKEVDVEALEANRPQRASPFSAVSAGQGSFILGVVGLGRLKHCSDGSAPVHFGLYG